MNKDKIGILLIFGGLFSLLFYTFSKEKELSENKTYTKAEIIDYYYVGGKRYIKYKFYVKGKKYEGEQKVSSFNCENGIGGCVGEKFTVTYSSKDPNNNDINLGKYNKYKPNRIRMFSLDD